LRSTTLLPDAVVRVDPAWKMKIEETDQPCPLLARQRRGQPQKLLYVLRQGLRKANLARGSWLIGCFACCR
jgi:hypothetical protein